MHPIVELYICIMYTLSSYSTCWCWVVGSLRQFEHLATAAAQRGKERQRKTREITTPSCEKNKTSIWFCVNFLTFDFWRKRIWNNKRTNSYFKNRKNKRNLSILHFTGTQYNAGNIISKIKKPKQMIMI